MSLTRVKPAGWAANETLTSGQQNSLDINVTNAVDKRSGQSDTVQSSLTFNTGTVTLAGATTISGAATISGTSNISACANIVMTLTNRVAYTSRTITKVFPMVGFTPGNTTNWATINLGDAFQNTTAGATLVLPFDLPIIGTLNSVTLLFKGATGHGALPALPTLSVYRYDNATGARNQLGTTITDPSGTVGAYETIHPITVPSIAYSIDGTTQRFGAVLVAETGGNFLTGANAYSLSASITVTAQAEL